MSWTWRYEDPKGNAVDKPRADTFSSQSDAESWLGEHWRELREGGVGQVVLLEDGAAVYGPMSLEQT